MKLIETEAKEAFNYKWLLSRIYKYIKPFMGRVILGFIIALPVGLLDGVVAYSLTPYIDIVIGHKNTMFAILISVAIVAFAAIQGVLRYFNSYLTDWTSQKITNSVKIDLFSRLVRMDTKFFDENSSGIVLSRYLSDPDTASTRIVEDIKEICTASMSAMALIIVMLTSSWKLAFVGVAVLCIAFLPVLLVRKKIKSVSNQGMVVGGSILTNFNETYSGNRVMTAYNLQGRQQNLFNNQIRQSFDLAMSLSKRVNWMSPLMYLIASFGIAFVIWFGTCLIINQQLTIGAFTSFVASLLLLYKPVKSLGNTLTGLQNVFVSMGRVFELFDIKPEIQDKEDAINLEKLSNNIIFEDVSFEYIKDIPVLKNINLEVQKNETLAIVGNSGGGKSTLASLLPRFYDVCSGSIKIDGIDIRNFKIESLRDKIALVFQDNFLFSGTIRENILLGKPSATKEELLTSVRLSHLEEFLDTLPNGIDTIIGERGTSLSGGQRQRVAIARAIIKNTPIVILDEATSALDNESEAVVQKALDNLMQNKTVFVIAHRLSTIKSANRIAVINDGKLVELGSHEQLMNIEDGQYKNLYEMQFRKQDNIVQC